MHLVGEDYRRLLGDLTDICVNVIGPADNAGSASEQR